MKTTSSTNSNAPVEKPKDTSSSNPSKNVRKDKAFAKVMERKTPSTTEPPSGAPMFMQSPGMISERIQETKESSGPAKLVDQLAAEIVNVGLNDVQLQFDSQTMGGLNVRISKQNGKLAVELNAQTSEISKLLSQNAEALAQRLESRGYVGASVQVRTSPPPPAQPRSQQDRGQQQQSQDGDGRRERRR